MATWGPSQEDSIFQRGLPPWPSRGARAQPEPQRMQYRWFTKESWPVAGADRFAMDPGFRRDDAGGDGPLAEREVGP